MDGGRRAVVVREGRALAIYIHGGEYHSEASDAQFAKQLRDARKMAAKVCSLPGVCCPASTGGEGGTRVRTTTGAAAVRR
ncbi:hypothetical protein [Streptosporangium sp. NPDC002607]